MTEMEKKGFPRAHVYPVLAVLLVIPLLGSVAYTALQTLEGLRQGELDITWLVMLIAVNLAYLAFSCYGIRSYYVLNKHFRNKYGEPRFVL